MTAIGFTIIAVMLVVSALEIVETDHAKAAAGFAVIVGMILFIAGIAVRLWQVMP